MPPGCSEPKQHGHSRQRRLLWHATFGLFGFHPLTCNKRSGLEIPLASVGSRCHLPANCRFIYGLYLAFDGHRKKPIRDADGLDLGANVLFSPHGNSFKERPKRNDFLSCLGMDSDLFVRWNRDAAAERIFLLADRGRHLLQLGGRLPSFGSPCGLFSRNLASVRHYRQHGTFSGHLQNRRHFGRR